MTVFLLTLSAIIGASALYPYIRDILRGRTRPRLVTWAVWTFLAGVMTVSALIAGELPSAVLSGISLVGCGIVVVLGWKRGSTDLGRLDIMSLVGAVVGLAALFWLQNPTVALVISVSIDAIAFGPTLLHAWTDPDEESLSCYVLNTVTAGLAIAAAVYAGGSHTGLIYPIYSAAFNTIMSLLLVTAKRLNTSASYAYGNEE